MLLDTRVVLWLALEPDRVSKSAALAIRNQRLSGEVLAISCISLYELARMSELGRILLDASLGSFLSRVAALFEVKPITTAVALAAARLPDTFPGDPADRLIAATAIVEGVPLITADRNIRRSRLVKTIW